MTKIVQIKNEQIFERSSVRNGSEAKNPLPINSKQLYSKLFLLEFFTKKNKNVGNLRKL